MVSLTEIFQYDSFDGMFKVEDNEWFGFTKL